MYLLNLHSISYSIFKQALWLLFSTNTRNSLAKNLLFRHHMQKTTHLKEFMQFSFLFPGQGSQSVGMGLDFYENFPVAKHTLEEACDALSFDIKQLIFEGPEETLTLTENTQPALVTVSQMILNVILHESGKSIDEIAHVASGHSLGEYSALSAAGSFSFGDALRLVRKRGQAMQEAVPVGLGAMSAILGLEFEVIESTVNEISSPSAYVVVANDNCPGQVVISGHKGAVEQANAVLSEKGAKRCLMLPVSAPFHSPLMEPAAEVMDDALGSTNINAPQIPTYANVLAQPNSDSSKIRLLLVEQITGRVRWRETIMHMAGSGITHFVEIGSGKVLTGLGKKITPEHNHINISAPADLDTFFQLIK
jgi:[acyl-carrier-protein] S-malonyltransferase